MRFCDVCESRLEDITTITELYYQCTKCVKRFPPSASDTLRYRQVFNKKESMIKYEVMLKNAAFDNVNPKEFKECPECKKKIVSYAVIGDSMRYVYVCTCGNQF
jgi:DNA-directed RNA polymerase subunit M/transcription elongation factor TFIIS